MDEHLFDPPPVRPKDHHIRRLMTWWGRFCTVVVPKEGETVNPEDVQKFLGSKVNGPPHSQDPHAQCTHNATSI